MACELLALGYMVQVRDGAQQQERGKTPRSCLQNLRHRFIVCLGVRSAADGEPAYLPEPLVVEPCFREQFTIAHPTPEYEALLQVRETERECVCGGWKGEATQVVVYRLVRHISVHCLLLLCSLFCAC